MNRPLNFNSLLLYIKAKKEKEEENYYHNNYDSDILYLIAQNTIKIMGGKPNKDLKAWSEIIGKIKGTIVEDNRSGEQIIEDTLNLFKE